jgi:plasmid stabilization system protein ParE
MDKRFTLRYLPLFERDLAAARDYIAFRLKNPAAALRLLDNTEAAIRKRLENPLGFEPSVKAAFPEAAFVVYSLKF